MTRAVVPVRAGEKVPLVRPSRVGPSRAPNASGYAAHPPGRFSMT